MLKNDKWIASQIKAGMIENGSLGFADKGVISSGISSFGYDVRLGPELKLRKQLLNDLIDPKHAFASQWQVIDSKGTVEGFFDVPPHTFVSGHSIEYFKLPRNITGIVLPKSTYARCGLNCFQTVLEAGWSGQITLEFANNTDSYIRLYLGEGCAQVLFFEGEQPKCSYDERNGKYQGSQGIGLPCVLAY